MGSPLGAAKYNSLLQGAASLDRLGTTGLEGLHIFHSENVGEPIEYSRCLPLPCFNKFDLTQKKCNCFVRYKTIPTLLCKDRR